MSCRSTKNFNNFVHGFDLVLPRKQRRHHIKLNYYASQGKYVNRRVVNPSQQQFWSSIPSGGHIIGVGWSGPDFSGQSKIAYFDFVVMAKDVLRFEISMKEAIFVKIGQSFCYFEEDRSNLLFGQGAITFFGSSVDLIQIVVQVVEDQKQFGIGQYDFSQFDNVGVL